MIINSQGFGHFTDGLNNQDFGIATPNMLMVLDGCSGAKYSEVGTRLFAQLFSKKEDFDNHNKFEENVKDVFEELLEMMSKYFPDEKLEEEFIMENLLFTIIACFKTEDKYIVKLFGDGYIITQNYLRQISYMRFYYGKYPPYYAYKYCKNTDFKHYEFKTFEFPKKTFPRVGIATDGILPIVKGEVNGVDTFIFYGNEKMVQNAIKLNKQVFYDDVTIAMFDDVSEVKNEEQKE